MKFKNPFVDKDLMGKVEITVIRLYIFLDILQRVTTLGIDQAKEFGKHFGIW